MSVVVWKTLKDEAGSCDLPGAGNDLRGCHGNRWTQLWSEEAEGSLPGGEQQVQVRRVR